MTGFDYLLESMKVYMLDQLKMAKFDRSQIGKISVDLGGGIYTVLINGETFDIPAVRSATYSVNDVVWIKIPNNNTSQRFIDCLVP